MTLRRATPGWSERSNHVVLIGMMGSGKTTIGSLLAARLGVALIDSDAQVQARTGRTVAEIFASEGEQAFRTEEKAALAEALSRPERAVIAAAGGTVLDADNRTRLGKAGFVVWLRADPAVLSERALASGQDHRPLLEPDPQVAMREIEAVRRPLYAELADLVVDVGHASVAESVEVILAALATRS